MKPAPAPGRSHFLTRWANRSAARVLHLGLAVALTCLFGRSALADDTVTAWDAAHADVSVTICLRSLGPQTAMTKEALHRIEAELSTSGFLVDQVEAGGSRSCAPNDPNIQLTPSAIGLDISASAGPGDDPVLQTVNASDPNTTAELIAIRAVEGLRAAMMQALRRTPDGMETAPESVRRFTRQPEDETKPEPTPVEEPVASTTTPVAEQAHETSGKKDDSSTDLLLTLGATGTWDGGSLGLNAALGVAWLLPPLALGIGIDGGIVPGSWNATAGSVELRPFGITGTVAARLPCGRSWECQLGAGAGMRQFSITAVSAPSSGPSVTAQENHSSVLLLAEAMAAYFPAPKWGMFLRGQVGFLVDAPALRLGAEALTWGRPSVGVTLGGAARF